MRPRPASLGKLALASLLFFSFSPVFNAQGQDTIRVQRIETKTKTRKVCLNPQVKFDCPTGSSRQKVLSGKTAYLSPMPSAYATNLENDINSASWDAINRMRKQLHENNIFDQSTRGWDRVGLPRFTVDEKMTELLNVAAPVVYTKTGTDKAYAAADTTLKNALDLNIANNVERLEAVDEAVTEILSKIAGLGETEGALITESVQNALVTRITNKVVHALDARMAEHKCEIIRNIGAQLGSQLTC